MNRSEGSFDTVMKASAVSSSITSYGGQIKNYAEATGRFQRPVIYHFRKK